MKHWAFIVFLLWCNFLWSQKTPYGNSRTVKLAIKDTVKIDSVSISPQRFLVYDREGNLVDNSQYQLDAAKATLLLSEEFRQNQDSITVHYVAYPSFWPKNIRFWRKNNYFQQCHWSSIFAHPIHPRKPICPFRRIGNLRKYFAGYHHRQQSKCSGHLWTRFTDYRKIEW